MRFAPLFALALLFANPSSAAHIIGVTVDNLTANGQPLDGTFDLSFEIYGSPTGSDLIFVEDVVAAVVVNGALAHDIGSTSTAAVPESVLKRDQVFLEVFLDGESVGPRTPIRSRSELAQTAETLNGFTETDFLYFAAVDGGLTLDPDNGFSIKEGGVDGSMIGLGAVTTQHLAPFAVSSGNIAVGAVTDSALAYGAVTSSRIAPDSIRSEHIDTAAVTTAKIAPGGVTANRIASNAVTTQKIADWSINAAKIAPQAVNSSHMATSAITEPSLATSAVSSRAIAPSAITEPKLANAAVGSRVIAPASVNSSHLNANLIELYSRPFGCGGGLEMFNANTCLTLPCSQTFTNGRTEIRFLNCNKGFPECVNLQPQVCNIGSNPVGKLLPRNY